MNRHKKYRNLITLTSMLLTLSGFISCFKTHDKKPETYAQQSSTGCWSTPPGNQYPNKGGFI